MAIAVDSANTGNTGASGTTVSWNHVVGASANKLVVIAAVNGSAPSSITADGNALTIRQTGTSGGNTISIWTLDNPPTGSIPIIVTKGNGVACAAGSISISGAASGIGGSNNASGSSSNPSNVVTTVASDGIVIDGIWSGGPQLTVGAGQTGIFNRQDFASTTRDAASSYEAFASGNDVTMDWTMLSDAWAWAGIEISESAGTTTSTSTTTTTSTTTSTTTTSTSTSSTSSTSTTATDTTTSTSTTTTTSTSSSTSTTTTTTSTSTTTSTTTSSTTSTSTTISEMPGIVNAKRGFLAS